MLRLAVFYRSSCAVLLLALAGSLRVEAQGPPPPLPPPFAPMQAEGARTKPLAPGPYRIAGRVLDAMDGHPLSHASITLFDTGDSGAEVSQTKTSSTGTFSIEHLPAGKLRLQGAARGYVTASYDEHEEFSSAIVTGAGLDTESLELKLQPGARMTGRVTDEAGDPVRNAAIALFHEGTESGTRRITMFRNARTDDLGQYELARLPAGTYYATVRAVPWYATHPPTDEIQQSGFGIAASVDPALDVTYPLVFYPEATDASGASPIRLKPGDRFSADFRLTPQPSMRLLFHRPELPPQELRVQIFPQLQQKVFDSYEPAVQQRTQVLGSSIEVSGLSAGRYVLRQAGQNGMGPARDVDLIGGSVTVEADSLPSFGAVTLHLAEPSAGQTAGHGKPAQSLQLLLQRVSATPLSGIGPPPSGRLKDGQVEIRNVEPGDYRIELAGGRYHVDSITEGGKTRPGSLLHVTGEGQSASITLGSGSVGMTGYARQDRKGESGAMVVLVPAGGDHGIDLYRRDQSDLDGSFRFSEVLPGNYLLIAIRDGWPLEWGKQEALAPYLSKAVPVTVPADGHGVMKIAEDVTVQPR